MFKNLALEDLGLSLGESEGIELALSHGFKGLNLDVQQFAEQVKTHGLDRASQRITSSRLKLGCFRLPLVATLPDEPFKVALQQAGELAALAASLGATRAVINIEPTSDTKPYPENFELYRRRLAEIAGMLEPHKIKLGVGFLAPHACRPGHGYQFMQTADEALLLLKTVSAPNIGLALDSWHWHLGGGTLDRLKSLSGDKIITVTLADVDPGTTAATAKMTMRKLPEEGGALDQAAMLATLSEQRYDGPVSVAADSSQLAGQSREQIVKNAAAALDKVWKAALALKAVAAGKA